MQAHWRNKDGEPVCEQHGEGEGDRNSNETDVPENCSVCGRLCNYSLTPDGIKYVMSAIREALDEGPESWNKVREKRQRDVGPPYSNSYYAGSRQIAVVRDWADDLKHYGGLTQDDEWLIGYFLNVTAEPVTTS